MEKEGQVFKAIPLAGAWRESIGRTESVAKHAPGAGAEWNCLAYLRRGVVRHDVANPDETRDRLL